MPRVPTLDENEYLEIEEAVASTVRGRAFLRMRDRRASLISGQSGKAVVADILNALEIRDSQRTGSASLDLLQRDLKELRDHIERSKSEIVALVGRDGKESSGTRLNGATEELYEIVAATERATSDILSAAEWIQERVVTIAATDDDRRDFDRRCMEIFTACSFQDITGQRIAKVVSTMSYVERRVNTMMSMWDAGDAGAVSNVYTGLQSDHAPPRHESAEGTLDPERRLLNGPQLPGHGLGQDAVDALFGKPDVTPSIAQEKPAARKHGGTPPETVKSTPAAPAATPAVARPPVKPTPMAPKVCLPPPVAAPAAAKAPETAKLDQSAVDALFN